MTEAEAAEAAANGLMRYRLVRHLDSPSAGRKERLLWVMLHPSTADANADDPTILRCKGFALAWGFHVMEIVYVLPWRADTPGDLFRDIRVRGTGIADSERNCRHIRARAETADCIVAAWDAHATSLPGDIINPVHEALRGHGLWCLGTTSMGAPKHPLHVPTTTELERWKLPS